MGTSTTSKLQILHNEIIASFGENKIISVTAIHGDPPDTYKVIYNLPSIFKDENGDIQESTNHEVLINIPFSFPHFPPSCKPLTPIYHPDFDPSAICIGDFWKKSKSIVEIIHYIGKMLSGEIFSTDNAFNSNAVKWYLDNSHLLPFDGTIKTPDQNPAEYSMSDMLDSADSSDFDIDTLDDSDFDTEFNYLDIKQTGKDETDSKSESPLHDTVVSEYQSLSLEREDPQKPAKLNVLQIQLLVKQKRFHELLQNINIIQDDVDIDDKELIINQAEKILTQAKKLMQKGSDFENQALTEKALQCYQKIQSLVSDYPDINNSIKRVTASLELPGGETTETDLTDKKQSTSPNNLEPKKRSTKITFFDEKKSKSFNIFQLGVLFFLLGILAFLIQSYLSLNSNLTRGSELLGLCKKSLQENQFSEAQSLCNQALKKVNKVLFIHQDKKKVLIGKISSVLSSQSLREGLAGNVLVEGRYISQASKQSLEDFRKLLSSAQHKMTASDWKGAAKEYQQSLILAENLHGVDKKQRIEIKKTIHIINIKSILQSAHGEMAGARWDTAIDLFNKALKIIKQYPDIQTKERPLIEQLIIKATFHKLYELGKKQIKQANWQQALKHLQQALSLAEKPIQIQPDTIKQLKNDINNVQLYLEIEKGKTAFIHGQLEKSLGHYNQAIQLMEEHQVNLKNINSSQYQSQLSRIMLNIEVVQVKQEVAAHLQQKQFNPASQKLASTIKLIKTSQFSQENEFQALIEEFQQASIETDFQLLLATSEQYLKENYKSLFIKYYPTSTKASLSKLKVTYVKKINGQLLFNLQCADSKGGNQLRLLLDYLYNPKTDRWVFYSEE